MWLIGGVEGGWDGVTADWGRVGMGVEAGGGVGRTGLQANRTAVILKSTHRPVQNGGGGVQHCRHPSRPRQHGLGRPYHINCRHVEVMPTLLGSIGF